MMETDRLILRNMTENDYDALYQVFADSDIMQHYPYTFDEARVRGDKLQHRKIQDFWIWTLGGLFERNR